MTYDQYWYEDPYLVRYYREADKLKQERMDAIAWLFGAYTGRALDATIGNDLKALFGKRGIKQTVYPESPISIADAEKKRKNQREMDAKKKEDQEILFAKIYMNNFIEVGKNWGKKGSDNG